MDSPCNNKKPTNRDPKQNQSQSCTPPQKNAYARLLSQHNSSKFSLYLKQHMVDTTPQTEEIMPSAPVNAQSDIQNVILKKGDEGPINFSNSAEFSPSALNRKGETSSLSLYMQKLVTRNGQHDCERKQGVSDRQHRAQRRDTTTTSYDGDVESGEELHLLKCNQSKKQQKKNQDCQDSDVLFGPPQTPKKASATGQEQKMANSKKKPPKNPEEGTSRQGTLKSGSETQMLRSGKGNKPQQTRGKLYIVCNMCCIPFFFFFFYKSFLITFFSAPNSPAHKNKEGKGKKKQVFESYLTLEEVSHGLKRGELIQVLIWIYEDLFDYGCSIKEQSMETIHVMYNMHV